MAELPKRKPLPLIIIAILALLGSYGLFCAMIISYFLLSFAVSFSPSNISQIVNFSAIMLALVFPGLVAGIVLGNTYPRRAAWLPLLILFLPLFLLFREQLSARHLVFLPGALFIGWAIAAYGKKRKKPWLLPALAALMIVSGLALLVGNSDRNWLLKQSSAALRHLGANPKRPSDIGVMDFGSLAPGGIYATVFYDEPFDEKAGLLQQAHFYIDSFDFRHRKLNHIFVERRITQVEVFPKTLAETRALGRRYHVPESLLDKLVQEEKNSFSAGPIIGTWDDPHLEINQRILLQIGAQPH